MFFLLFMASILASGEPALKPLAFYLKNLPAARVGTLSDEQIKTGLEADGFIVIEVDCSSFPKTSPELENELVKFHKNCASVYSSYENSEQKVDIKSIMYVPEGYTVTKDIPVWNIRDHGADGSVERVVKFWNDVIVSKHGQASVTDADQMHNPDGSPIDWWLRMDIIHPSGKVPAGVPLLLNFSSNSPRFSPFSPENTDQVIWRNIFPIGFLTTGYAFANADHCYNPLARNDTWGYHDQYSLEDWNGLAAVRAYVRYLKGHMEDYNLNGKIGVMGISKASYSAVRIADPENASGSEHALFNGTPNTKEQPWPGYDSRVDVSYAAAGNGSRRIPKYINAGCVPMITSVGKTDQYGHWAVYPEVVRHMVDIDHIHLPLWMEELGHTYPGMGTDMATGEDRYVLFKRFFDHYLKPEESTRADVFYILPKEGASVDVLGRSRILPPDAFLPQVLLGLPKESPVCVRFLESYPVEEVSGKVTITPEEGGEPVTGTWEASMHGTCFKFTPDVPFSIGKSYKITVPTSLAGPQGHPSAEVTRSFSVSREASPDSDGGQSKVSQKILPLHDTYSAVAKNTTPRGDQATLRMRYSTAGDWRFDSYWKFDLSEIDTLRLHKVTLNLAMSAAISDKIKINFYKTGTGWTESELVSSNKPVFESNYFDVVTAAPESSWLVVDATQVVKDCLAKGEKELSIAGRVPSSETSSINVYVHSKEAENESLRPYLAVSKSVHLGNPTIWVARKHAVGDPVRLSVAAGFEDDIKSVNWYVDDVLSESETITPPAGKHKIKAVIDGGESVGKVVIIKYITVE